MQLLSVNDIFSANLIQALCWTLVHSLWTGLLLTIVTAIIILCTKTCKASTRYNLLVAALFLFTITMVVIFMSLLAAAGHTLTAFTGETAAAAINTGNTPLFNSTGNSTGFTVPVINFFNAYANLIVLVWLLMIIFRCIRFAGGMYQLKRMRTTQLVPITEDWKKRLSELSAALNISQNIQFFQSGIARIPMVLGHFKPVILFPLGLITTLPAAEVEAVLLHELAHIRRKDYLVNMLQQVVEIVLFFNPAVLWLSSLIKIERENCCDDIAVAQSSSKRNYINALLSFPEYQLNAPQYATAFANKKYLLQRVKRMLYNNNKTLNNMEKTFLTVCFVAATSLTLFFTQPITAQSNGATPAVETRDTVISIANKKYNPADFKEGGAYSFSEKINGISHTLYIFKRKGVLYEIYGNITSFKIDGKTIAREEWGKYKTLISQLKKDYENGHLAENGENIQLEKLKAEQLQLIAEKNDLNSLLFSLNSNDSLKFGKDQLAAERNKLNAELQLLQKGDRSKTGQMELLAKQDKLMAELESLKNMQLAKNSQMKLKLEQEQLNAQLLNLKYGDSLHLNKLQFLNEEDKLKTELELMQRNDKIKAEQQELLLQLSKSQAEYNNKALLFQKQAVEMNTQKTLLQLSKQDAKAEAEKQSLLIEKLKLAEKKLQDEKAALKLKKQ